jgi:hypothetical protein
MGFDLKDYVEVKDRLQEWWAKYPDGRVHTEVTELTEDRVTVRAEAYRKLEDLFPAGVGHSYMQIPGTTPYTKGSEIENAETSAVGRALVMAGLSAKASIASRDEVAAKMSESGNTGKVPDSDKPSGRKPSGGKKATGSDAGGPSSTGRNDTEPEPPTPPLDPDGCLHPRAELIDKPQGWQMCPHCHTAKKREDW